MFLWTQKLGQGSAFLRIRCPTSGNILKDHALESSWKKPSKILQEMAMLLE